MLNPNVNLVDLPAGAKAVSFWTGFGFRCVVVDREGKSLFKHFAFWDGPPLALVKRVNQERRIHKDLWFDAEGKALKKNPKGKWEYAPRKKQAA